MEQLQLSFGQWLKRRRQALALTQEDLARRVGCSVSAIRKFESNVRQPSLQIAELLAGALQLQDPESPSFLLWAQGKAPPGAFNLPADSVLPARRAGNVPALLTPLIGRQYELSTLLKWLAQGDSRLLTLTGPPGVGKTRLALEVATALRSEFADGVYLAALASLRDPALVIPTIAQTLGLRESSSQPMEALIEEYLSEREVLLILDNFEHLLAAAPLLGKLLMACPRAHALVTSRSVLKLPGERQLRVPPLPLPSAAEAEDFATLAKNPAIALFVERAHAVQPSFQLSPANAATVVQLCRGLDGIPLALELAAARLNVLAPEQILARLADRFRLLKGGRRMAPLRQRALVEVVSWSYEQLSAAERALFNRLSVFAGGWTLEAAEAVAGADDLRCDEVLDLLSQLVDRSLVMVETTPQGPVRYRLLETLAQYGRERLLVEGQADASRRRHAEYYLALAESADSNMDDAQQQDWGDRLEREHENIAAALAWTIEQEQIELALRLGAALWRFWHERGHFAEGWHWLQRLLALSSACRSLARAAVLNGAGALAFGQGQYGLAQSLHAQSLALLQDLDEDSVIPAAVSRRALLARFSDEYRLACVRCKQDSTREQALGQSLGFEA